MRRNRGGRSGRGGEVRDDSGEEFVVSAGVTIDYSIVDERRLTVIVRGVMRHAILKTDKVMVTGCFHGTVEASTLEVAKGGLFVGKAMVHTATIGGRLEGILVASGMLNMKASGHCDGVLRYGDLNVQYGAQLTGAVKAASAADASIGEIPVPDLPEGTWDKHHWSSRKNIKKRVMRSMMGGEQSSRRGGYGLKRARGGPRILRSAGQTARSDSEFARQAAENAFREMTEAATAAGVPVGHVLDAGGRGETGATPPLPPSSSSLKQLLGGEFHANEAVMVEGSSQGSIRMGEGRRGDGSVESAPPLESVPWKYEPKESRKGKVRRAADRTGRADAVAVAAASGARVGAGAAGGASVGRKNGESVGSNGLRALLHLPPVDGCSPAGSDSEIDMMDFLEEAAQLLGKGETKKEGVDSGSYDDSSGLVEDHKHIHITQEGLNRLRQAPQRRLGSTEPVPVRMTSVPAVPAVVATTGATAAVVSAAAEEGTLTMDGATAGSSAASVFFSPSNSGADRTGETVSDIERASRAETPRTAAAAAVAAAVTATSPTTIPAVMSRNLVDDRCLPAALLAAFAEVERGSFEEDNGDVARQEPVEPVAGSVGTRAGGVEGEGAGFAKSTTHTPAGNLEISPEEDRARKIEEAKAVLRSKFAIRKKTQGLHGAGEQIAKSDEAETAATSLGNGFGNGDSRAYSHSNGDNEAGASPLKKQHEPSSEEDRAVGSATAADTPGAMAPTRFPGFFSGVERAEVSYDDDSNNEGGGSNDRSGGTRSGSGGGDSEGGVFVEGSHDAGRGAASETLESVPASVVAAAAAAAALRAGNTSLSAGPSAVLPPNGGAKAELPLPEARGFRVCGTYTEAAVAAVAKATAAVPAVAAAAEEKKDGHSAGGDESKAVAVLKTPMHGKLRGLGDSVRPPSAREVYASPPHEFVLGKFREGSSAKSNRSPPPGPSANTHRRQAAREREMRRGPRLLPATTTTSLEFLDRSKLPLSPTRRSRPETSPTGQSGRRGWVSVPVQKSPAAAAAAEAARGAAAAANLAKNAAKMAERSARNNSGTDFDWSRVGMFPLGQRPATDEAARLSPLVMTRSANTASSSSSTSIPGGVAAGHATSPAPAPTSPIVSMPLVEGFARSVGRGKPPEEVEAEHTWSVGLEALVKQESTSSPEVGSARVKSAAATVSAPAAAEPKPSSSIGGDSGGVKDDSVSTDTASAFALGLGAALSSAMASREVGVDVGSTGEDSTRVHSAPAVASREKKALLEREDEEEEGDSGDDARWRWREVRDRARESTGIGPAMMARQKYAAAGPRATPAGLKRSALPTVGQFRRQSMPATSQANLLLAAAAKSFTVSPAKSPRPISRALATAQDTGDAGSRDLGSATAAAVAVAAAAAEQVEADDDGVMVRVDQSEVEEDGVVAKIESEIERDGGIGRAGQSEKDAEMERGEDGADADTDAGSDFAVEEQTVSAVENDKEEDNEESACASALLGAATAASGEFGIVVSGVGSEERMAGAREDAVAVLGHAEGDETPVDAEKCSVSAIAMSTSEVPLSSEAEVMYDGADNGANDDAFADKPIRSTEVNGPTAHHSLSEIAVPKPELPVVDAMFSEREEACETPIVSAANTSRAEDAAAADETEAADEAAVNETEASDHVTAGQATADQVAAGLTKAGDQIEAENAEGEAAAAGEATAEEEPPAGKAEGDAAAEAAASTVKRGEASLAYKEESGAQSEPAASDSAVPMATATLETPAAQTTIHADIDDTVESTNDAARSRTVAVEPAAGAAESGADAVKSVADAAESVADAAESVEESAAAAAGSGANRSVRIPVEFSSTEDSRRSSSGDRSPRERGVLTGKVEGKDLPRIRSEGGMVARRAGVLVAGRPMKKHSGFMAPKDVRQGLGPAGAFTGNANWRVDAVRDKPSSVADVKADGHGGFHNPMAALRAQQQQQQQQRLQQHHVRVGRIAPAPEGSYASGGGSSFADVLSSESAPSDGRSGGGAGDGLPSVPAWMVNKGLVGGGRNPQGVLLGRPARGRLHGGGRGGSGGSALRPSAGSVLGRRPSTTYGPLSGGRVGVGFGGDSVDHVRGGSASASASSTNEEVPSSPLANEKASPLPLVDEEAPSLPLTNEEAPLLPLTNEKASSESRAVSSSSAPSRPEKKELPEGKSLLDSSGDATTAGTTSIDTGNDGAFPETASSLPAADARDSKRGSGGLTLGVSVSSAFPLATIIPTNEESPPPGEAVEATHAGGGSGDFVNGRIGLSGGAPVKAGREVGKNEEMPLFGTEIDSGAESSGADGEFLEHPSSPGASGGFAALGRFLFGSRTGSQQVQIVPGEEVRPSRGGKPRDEDSLMYYGGNGNGGGGGGGHGTVDEGGRNGIGGLLRGGSGGGSGRGIGIGGNGSRSRSGESVSAAGSASNVSDRVGSASSSSSECTTAPTSSADGDADADGDVGDAGDGDVAEIGNENVVVAAAAAEAAEAVEREVSETDLAPPGFERARNASESSTSPFVDVVPAPPLVELSPMTLSVRENGYLAAAVTKETAETEVEAQARSDVKVEAELENETAVEMAAGTEAVGLEASESEAAQSEAAGSGAAASRADLSDAEAEEGNEEDAPAAADAAAAAAAVAAPTSGSAITMTKLLTPAAGIASPLRVCRRVGGSRPGSRAVDSPSNISISSSSSNNTASGSSGSRPVMSRAVSLLSGERKTGLAALEHQGTTAKATRRALLEETRQRRAADTKPKPTIFETLRQRSSKNASNVEKRNTLSGRRRHLSTRAISERPSLLIPSPRRASARATEHSSISSSGRIDFIVETPSTAVGGNGGGGERVVALGGPARRSGGSGGVAIEVGVDEVDYDEVDPGSDEEDGEPDFWSKYGVIDAAALDEDAEIEI